jgi:hypothetical protein
MNLPCILVVRTIPLVCLCLLVDKPHLVACNRALVFFFMVYMFMPNIQGPFAKFMDLPYYSESELCTVVVMVSFSK